jgi:hypothetical protein
MSAACSICEECGHQAGGHALCDACEFLLVQEEKKSVGRPREVTEEQFHQIDGIICQLESQGRPSQAADAGWHEALAAIRAALLARMKLD